MKFYIMPEPGVILVVSTLAVEWIEIYSAVWAAMTARTVSTLAVEWIEMSLRRIADMPA